MTPILAVECVAKAFGERRVLSSASLRAVPGELRALVGRNGAGKSTLLKIAAGCLAPDTGSIHFAGRAYLSAKLHDLAAHGLFYLPDHDLLSSAFLFSLDLWTLGNLRDLFPSAPHAYL